MPRNSPRDRSGEYARRKERCLQLNICFRCSQPKGQNTWLCNGCQEKTNNNDKIIRQQRKLVGLCKCGATPTSNKEYCNKCLEEGRKQQARRRSTHKMAGTCLTCGNPPEQNKFTCGKCNVRATNSTLERYYHNISIGKCAFCSGELNLSTFRCDTCHKEHIQRGIKNWEHNKQLVYEYYEPRCVCCHENKIELLEIDHISNDGAYHRRHIHGHHLYEWIIVNNYPTNLQVMCANCNRGRAKFGVCPHYQEPHNNHSHGQKKKRRRRLKAINNYGCKCKCCGESNWAFLEFDHINNDGNIHRKTVSDIVSWIIINNYPDTIQLLCSNCNKAKGLYGICPHQEKQLC